MKRKSGFKYPSASMVFLMVVFSASLALARQTDVADKAMELSGFSVSESFEVEDDGPLMPASPFLTRLLYRFGNLSIGNLNLWSEYSSDVSWEQLVSTPRSYRFWTFHREGEVHSISTFRYGPEAADDLLKGFFINYCRSADGQPFAVLTRSSGKRLPVDTPTMAPQPVSFSGFFYGNFSVDENGLLNIEPRKKSELERNADGDDDAQGEGGGKTLPVFIANRLAWYPVAANEELKISESHVSLAKAGVDVGQFDYVAQQNSKPLGQRDSDCFFQTIAAVKTLGADLPATRATFVDLMKNPTGSIGEATVLQGRVRACTPVKLQNADVKALIGADRYYQLILFPDLDGQKVVVKNSAGEDQVFSSFPVTVCITELPDGLAPEEMEGRQLFVEGFFFRFWSYTSSRSMKDGVKSQVSPLVIASQARPIKSNAEQLNSILSFGLLGLLVGLCFLFWFIKNRDRSSMKRVNALPQSELPGKIDTSNFDSVD